MTSAIAASDAVGVAAAGGSGDRVMNRRAFIGVMAGGLLAAPLALEVQHAAARVPRIGTLWPAPASAPTVMRVTEAFKQGLEQGGYVNGKTVTVEYTYAEQDQMSRAANDLVELNVGGVLLEVK